jgi:transcriptional regulator with XRE-family HTH domain
VKLFNAKKNGGLCLAISRRFMGGFNMTTSRQMEFLSEILEWKPIPQDTLVYFRERLRHRLHSAILDAFTQRAKERELKQKDLATRIHKSRVQINRWLSTASNLTLDSISDLMVGLGMDFDTFPFTPIEETLADKRHKKPIDRSTEVDSSTKTRLDSNALLVENPGRTIEQTKAILQNWPPPEVKSTSKSGAATIPSIPIPVVGAVSGVSEELQKLQRLKLGRKFQSGKT